MRNQTAAVRNQNISYKHPVQRRLKNTVILF